MSKPKYFVDGWGYKWWVMSRNNRPVAQCNSKAMATKIAKLLTEDAEMKAIPPPSQWTESTIVDTVFPHD